MGIFYNVYKRITSHATGSKWGQTKWGQIVIKVGSGPLYRVKGGLAPFIPKYSLRIYSQEYIAPYREYIMDIYSHRGCFV